MKSWPDRSQVNGRRSRLAPGARTAVPIALNSMPPVGEAPTVSRTPTTPCPPSSGAFGAHPGDGGASRLVQGLHKRPERSRAATPRHLSDHAVGADHAVPERSRAVVPAGVADIEDRGAEHLPHRLEADAADRGELVPAQANNLS